MTIYDKIFTFSKKIARALTKGKEPDGLKETDLFSETAKGRMLQDLSEETINDQMEQLKAIDGVKDWEEVYKRLEPRKHTSKAFFYKIAAVVLLLISITYMTFYQKTNSNDLNKQVAVITAGTDKAILTLENGDIIPLEKGRAFATDAFQTSGERLEYLKGNTETEVVYNYLTVPRGGQYQIILSDGTTVWLNADTKLKYPKSFKIGETRKVELLYGEAYFDVSPSKNHNGYAFNVLTKDQVLEVFGTKFNIKAYKEEQIIYTTLVEGKVGITIDDKSENLNPGEQTALNIESRSITKYQVETDYDIAWTRGYFNFKDKPLKDIMIVLARWYDIEVTFESNELEDATFSGLLNKKQSIEDILNGIKNTKFINAYDIKDKSITIK